MYILNVQTTAAILLILMVRLADEKWCPQPPKIPKQSINSVPECTCSLMLG